MILSDQSIKDKITSGEIKLIPWENQVIEKLMENIVCASMDLELWNEFRFFKEVPGHVLNPFDDDSKDITEAMRVEDGEDLIIQPWAFLLAATKERFGIPDNLVARVEGRSSLWRLGLIIHVTAWFIDPGFGRDAPSTITLEISNINHVPIIIRPWMRICQLAFDEMDQPSAMPYNKKKKAKYNGQQAPQASKLFVSG